LIIDRLVLPTGLNKLLNGINFITSATAWIADEVFSIIIKRLGDDEIQCKSHFGGTLLAV